MTYAEGDFFGPDGTDFRLRHAYGEIGDKHKLLGGQTWSTFMDASVYPAIFDYQGPNGMVLVRQPMVRYTEKFRDDLQWQIALEDPNPDLSESGGLAGNGTSQWPDLASNVRWSPSWGHLQLAGILRELTFDPAVGSRSSSLAWGLNFTGTVNVGPEAAKGKQDNVVFEITGGQGIANYFNDTNGLGLDGFVKTNGKLEALDIWGGFVAYQHYWSPRWASTAGYSYLHVDNTSSQDGGTYRSGHYVVVNVTYEPIARVWLGLEALYGIREDKDGSTGDDGRLSFSVQYRF
ncbi:MAG TPA: DcaP family trimeric outer membrane transporter [Tepidisphaeraceae bacterium]